jgi:hypothetical protein
MEITAQQIKEMRESNAKRSWRRQYNALAWLYRANVTSDVGGVDA